ncbi:MAG: cytochrome C oxidase subunit III, partial [Bacteroidetes bacterium HGW-Bacteroidetes-9]
MEQTATHHADPHRDDTASKIGMWLFIFTEILLFGGMFIVYSVYRFRNPVAFHLAHEELSIPIGFINTVILLVSSATVAISISAMQKKDKKMTLMMLGITLVLALAFLVNKYFEWGAKFEHGMFPGSELMKELSHGDMLFFSLYFFMTGLHAVHIIVGMVLLAVSMYKVKSGSIDGTNYALLENS